ncbi:hypothetical protein BD410DRAFT_831151 [Rickenella mellea]|uniref:BTB domain-containing protein n=1 Tax=Rickenella mellea TaxID=50990 RepID=A0A4Y7PU00_9AGAM|nr:hypothetical protein BD410DRAFT_831151 [Rickenella mellea]
MDSVIATKGKSESSIASGPSQDDNFFFKDGNVVFLARGEDIFPGSSLFPGQRLAGLEGYAITPVPVDTHAKGSSVSKPIVLEQIRVVDFKSLLWFFYNSHYEKQPSWATEWETWTSILRLAKMWAFDRLLIISAQKLQGIKDSDPLAKIEIALQYGFEPTWALTEYHALCRRDAPLNLAEMRRLPLEILMKVAAMREQRLRLTTTDVERTLKQSAPGPSNERDELEQIIQRKRRRQRRRHQTLMIYPQSCHSCFGDMTYLQQEKDHC